MFGLFKTKKITIPLDNAQEVTELESWTIKWVSYKYDGGYYDVSKTYNKVFIIEEDANEFIKQLKEAAEFLKTTIETEKIKN